MRFYSTVNNVLNKNKINTQYLLNWLMNYFDFIHVYFDIQEKKKWRLQWVWSDFISPKGLLDFLYCHITFSQSNCMFFLSTISPDGINELFWILFYSYKHQWQKEINKFFLVVCGQTSSQACWMNQILIRLF